MTDSGQIVAALLESSASGYASAASASVSGTAERALPPGWGSSEWKANLRQRILELATAVRVNEPDLFARRIIWLRRAIRARNATESDLRTAIESIRNALQQELPEEYVDAVELPLVRALAALDADIESDSSALDPFTDHGRLALEYLTTCLEARPREAIDLILAALEEGESTESIYTDVLLPAQREIGDLWHMGDVTISQERLVSETTKSAMSLIVHRYAPPPKPDHVIVAASVAGNAHDIGLRASSDLFALAGWRSIFLGANVPSMEIAQAAHTFEAEIALLSATLTTQLNAIAEAISRIREFSGKTRLLVGGQAFDNAPDLWQQLGADAFAKDVRSVVGVAEDLLTAD